QARGFLLLCVSQPSAKRSYGAGRPVCVVEVEARACPLGSYFGGASVSTARAACPLVASAAVTAVTGYSSNSPLFFGRPICASQSRLGLLVMTRHSRRCVMTSPRPALRLTTGRVGALTRSAPCIFWTTTCIFWTAISVICGLG